MKVTKKTTEDKREYFEVTKEVKSIYFKKDIEKQISDLDKSIAHFEAEKVKLQQLYATLK